MKLIFFVLNEFDRYLVVGLGHVLFEEYLSVQHLQTALDIFQSETYIAFIQFVEIVLCNAATIMMQPDKELLAAGILRQVNKAGIAVFEDIVDQFLDDAENDELGFRLQSFAVVMEPGAGIHAAGATDLLEQIVDG